MKKVIPICTECGDELRLEHLVDDENRGYTSGFCLRCAKHFRLCSAVRYMHSCMRLRNHEGEHKTNQGDTWIGEWRY